MSENQEKVLTLAEAAEFLKVSQEDVEKLASAQQIPGRKIGCEWRFLRSTLENWLSGDYPTVSRARANLLAMISPALSLSVLEELEQRLLTKLQGAKTEQETPISEVDRANKKLLKHAGILKDDPSIETMLEKISQERGIRVEEAV